MSEPTRRSPLDHIIWFCLNNKLIVLILVILFASWGTLVAPFDWEISGLDRDPVPVDAIPDIGENQQIVFTQWMGRSPQDIEDQVTYPLTTALLGVPGVKTVRSYSFFGFSSIYVIFKEEIDFYWSRSRILEKLNSLPQGTLPEAVQPTLGPDATGLGQVFWYTLEGRDAKGNATGGWDLNELRTIQDWTIRYKLLAVNGIAEVASVGGFIQEYQVDVDPDAMRAYGVSLTQIMHAVRMANLDVGARNIEINNVEYFIRGIGFIKEIADIEQSVVTVRDEVPIYVKDVANVALGPAQRRGILDKEGAEVVGGVVLVRYGENPLNAIKELKKAIAELQLSLPKKTLADGTISQIALVPFYDRSGLIYETLGTLSDALTHELLVTIIVVLLMLWNLRSSAIISALLPLAVLMTFIAMKVFEVDANIVALSGIAIAIGTMVDMAVVMVESILKHIHRAGPDANLRDVVYEGAREVSGAVVTAVSTTIISFLPVFTMIGAEGKLFKPLAFTKTFALVASIIVSMALIPPICHLLFSRQKPSKITKHVLQVVFFALGFVMMVKINIWLGLIVIAMSLAHSLKHLMPAKMVGYVSRSSSLILAVIVAKILANAWMPLGLTSGQWINFIFVVAVIGSLLLFFTAFQKVYPSILTWALDHKALFMIFPSVLVVWGFTAWLGFSTLFGWMGKSVLATWPISSVDKAFPGFGKEFMPPLDEGSYLYMPTTSVHASIDEARDIIRLQDMKFSMIPEIESAVAKLGRAETSLDPAPISMIETIINTKSQYLEDRDGGILSFAFEHDETDLFRDSEGNAVNAIDGKPYRVKGRYQRDDQGRLIPDPKGRPFRQWRSELDPDLNEGRNPWSGIEKRDDIWDLIVAAGKMPGVTSAPKLQPIAARIVMLQSGMRAPMGIKLFGTTLESVEQAGIQVEQILKTIPSVNPDTVVADRIIGKPYIEIHIDRNAIARYGVRLEEVQRVIEVAIGGMRITTTVEGRQRFPVRVRYPRELRDMPDQMKRVLVPTASGSQIPLGQLTRFDIVKGPQVIKSEDNFLVSYVIFDMKPGHAEVDVMEEVIATLDQAIASKQLIPPAGGYQPAGSYQNQLRSIRTLRKVLPLALVVIFLILYLQFKKVSTSLLVFSGIIVGWSGGFSLLWLYGQDWFLNFHVLGVDLRELFQIHPINLSVAIWVGFLALFGIASDDGVIIGSYLEQVFDEEKPDTAAKIRAATVRAGSWRIRPATMTAATTIIALIPVLTSQGRGSDIMVPMAIPTVGGMLFVIISIFVVPVLYCLIKETELSRKASQ